MITSHQTQREIIKPETGRLNTFKERMGEVAGACHTKISNVFGGLKNGIAETFSTVKQGMSRAFSYGSEKASETFKSLGNACSTATGYDVEAIKGLATLTKNAVASTYDFAKKKFNDCINFIKGKNQKPDRQIVFLQNQNQITLPKLPRKNVSLKPKTFNIKPKHQKTPLKKKIKLTIVYFEVLESQLSGGKIRN